MMILTFASSGSSQEPDPEKRLKQKPSRSESASGGPARQHRTVENQPPGIAPDPREHKKYYIEMTPFRRVVQPVLLSGFRLLTRFTVSGAEQTPTSGPVILAANHLTNYDVFFLQAAIARPIFFMGKEELFRHPVADWTLRQLGGFPVYRGAGDEWALSHAEKVLRAGQVLGIFPEGTRSKGKGLKPAKTGAARLALAVGCPIIPVALYGPQYLFKRVSRRTPIWVTVGEAVLPDPDDSPLALTDRFMFALARMLPEEQRGAYQTHPEGF
jgi:1-acyl-sn-glycerol-3-phosphate acyltransferase